MVSWDWCVTIGRVTKVFLLWMPLLLIAPESQHQNKVKWTRDCEKAIHMSERTIVLLTCPRQRFQSKFHKPFVLQVDAFDREMRAVLSQGDDETQSILEVYSKLFLAVSRTIHDGERMSCY